MVSHDVSAEVISDFLSTLNPKASTVLETFVGDLSPSLRHKYRQGRFSLVGVCVQNNKVVSTDNWRLGYQDCFCIKRARMTYSGNGKQMPCTYS